MFCRLMIRSHSLSEPISLDRQLHKRSLVFFLLSSLRQDSLSRLQLHILGLSTLDSLLITVQDFLVWYWFGQCVCLSLVSG